MTKTFEEAMARARKMSEGYVRRGPYRFFPDEDTVDAVQRGLAQNEVKYGHRYCP